MDSPASPPSHCQALLGLRDLQILEDLAGEFVVDLTVSRDGGDLPRGAVDVNGVRAAFPEKLAAVLLQYSDEVPALHAAWIRRGSRIT